MSISTLMSFSTLFWAMCAVLGANVVVAVIAVAKAYRDERASSRALPRALPIEP
jgi:hypothetical protein